MTSWLYKNHDISLRRFYSALPCEPYDCGAFDTHLSSVATDYWPLTDAGVGPGYAGPIDGENMVRTIFPNRLYQTAALPSVFGADDCGGLNAQVLNASTDYYSIQLGDRATCMQQERWIGGVIKDPENFNGNPNLFFMGVDRVGGSVISRNVSIVKDGSGGVNLGGDLVVNVPNLDSENKPILWYARTYESVDKRLTIDVWINGSYVGTAQTGGNSLDLDWSSSANFCELMAFNGRAEFNYLFYMDSEPDHDLMVLAFSRNFSDYTPPSWCDPPTTFPPPCAGCDALDGYPATNENLNLSKLIDRDGLTNIPQEMIDIGLTPANTTYDGQYFTTAPVAGDPCFSQAFYFLNGAGAGGSMQLVNRTTLGCVFHNNNGNEFNIEFRDTTTGYPNMVFWYSAGQLVMDSGNGDVYTQGPVSIPNYGDGSLFPIYFIGEHFFTQTFGPDRWWRQVRLTAVTPWGITSKEVTQPFGNVSSVDPGPATSTFRFGESHDCGLVHFASGVGPDYIDYFDYLTNSPSWCSNL